MTEDGHFFHIDFGHFLGNTKKKFGVNRERAPFVLTPDFIYVMDRKDGARFKRCVKCCIEAYDVLRQHARLLIALFAMMLSTGMPELNSADDIRYLQNVLLLDLPSAEALATFEKILYDCINVNWGTQVLKPTAMNIFFDIPIIFVDLTTSAFPPRVYMSVSFHCKLPWSICRILVRFRYYC